MIGNEDGIIEEEMIELCGSADINDLILYCRSLKNDVQHQTTKLLKIRNYAQNGGMDVDDAFVVMDIINGEDEEE